MCTSGVGLIGMVVGGQKIGGEVFGSGIGVALLGTKGKLDSSN